MPSYLYKCCECKDVVELMLPISTDPKKMFACPCGYTMKRIMRPFGAIKGLKTFAGDWFKKTYGHDIGEAYEDKARQKEDFETMKRELEKDK